MTKEASITQGQKDGNGSSHDELNDVNKTDKAEESMPHTAVNEVTQNSKELSPIEMD